MLRLRLSGFNGKDLAALVICFGEAWLLAGQMEQGDSFRNKLETGVQTLGKSILKGASDFHDSTFDTLLDLTALTSAIVAASIKKEYLHACDTLKPTVSCRLSTISLSSSPRLSYSVSQSEQTTELKVHDDQRINTSRAASALIPLKKATGCSELSVMQLGEL